MGNSGSTPGGGARQPSALVIVGPSGVGKGTLIDRLMDEGGENVAFSCSHTTRAPRPGEEVGGVGWGVGPRKSDHREGRRMHARRWRRRQVPSPEYARTRAPTLAPALLTQDGVHYHFTTRTKMEKEIKEGKFLEYAYVHDNIYGTSFQAVQDVAKSGRCCVLDIDVQGARQVRGGGGAPAAAAARGCWRAREAQRWQHQRQAGWHTNASPPPPPALPPRCAPPSCPPSLCLWRRPAWGSWRSGCGGAAPRPPSRLPCA